MPKFITIGYGNQDGYDRTPEAIRNAAHSHDASLKQQGVLMGIAGSPVQVRNAEASGTHTSPGSYMSSPLPIAGFAIIDADNIEAAIKMVSQSPCAVAHGVVEVWPLEQLSDAV